MRWRASTAPVWLWRMNIIPLIPDSSRPLTTEPSGSLTSVPAVTYRPASTMQSSPRLIPMPAFPVDQLIAGQTHGDLLIQIGAQHRDTVVHTLRELMRTVRGTFQQRWSIDEEMA